MSPSNLNKPSNRGFLTANLIAQLALGLLVMTIALPSMQEWAAIFGTTQAAVQLTFSGYVVAYGLLQLLYGPLSDRLGRKNVLLFGIALTIVGSMLAASASKLPTLVAARILQGMGCAAGMVIGRALVQDLFAIRERTKIMAYIGMTMGVMPPLATVLGGYLHVRFGWQSNFILVTGLAICLFVSAWRGLPDHQATNDDQTHWLRAMLVSYRRLAGEPSFLLYVVILSLTTATFYVFLAGAPLVLGGLGVRPDGVGYYIMVGPLSYVIGNFLTSRLAHRASGRRIMWMGQGVAASGIVIMVILALSELNSPLAFALPMILLGLGHGLLVPPALSGTVSLLPALAGAAAAVAGVMQQLLGAVGGFAVGLLTQTNAQNIGIMMLAMITLAIVAQALLHRELAK